MELVSGNYLSSRIWRSFLQGIKPSTKTLMPTVYSVGRLHWILIFICACVPPAESMIKYSYAQRIARSFIYVSDVTDVNNAALKFQIIQNKTRNVTQEESVNHTNKPYSIKYSQLFFFSHSQVFVYINQYDLIKRYFAFLFKSHWPLKSNTFFQTCII